MKSNGLFTFTLIDPCSYVQDFRDPEELRGAVGKDIYFRQERHQVENTLKDVAFLQPRIESTDFTGPLVDFSISGASCLVSDNVNFSANQVIPQIKVLVGSEVLYRGQARVVYLSQFTVDEPKIRVGLHLLDGVIDTVRIFQIRSSAEMDSLMRNVSESCNDTLISREYRGYLADLLYVFVKYRSILNKQEKELADLDPSLRTSLEEEILWKAWENLKQAVAEPHAHLNRITREFIDNKTVREAYRDYTIPIITPYFADAPVLFHTWYKPLGYPGDHVAMTYLYERKWEGKHLFAKLIHRLGVDHPFGYAVRARRDFLKHQIFNLVDARNSLSPDAPLRILSLGSGPAREVIEFAREYQGNRQVEFTLIDQDNSALAFVNKNLAPYLAQKRGKVSCNYLNLAFRQILKEPEVLQVLGKFDFVFCSGLFDYLKQRQAIHLSEALFKIVPQDGLLILGNFAGPPEHAWTLTHGLDWHLEYRTDEMMYNLADKIKDQASEISLLPEETGQYKFLVIKKKMQSVN